jgi:NADPH-dependent curcumin reductase CurA
MKSTQIRLVARPVTEPLDSDFEVVTEALSEPGEGQVLIRTLYLSLDPYMRGRMSEAESYAEPVALGDVMVGQVVAEVIASRSERRAVGDIVLAYTGWQTHAVVDARVTRRLNPDVAPVTTALGVLGMPGFTAYAGLLAIGQPKPGETVVVAAATGPVGSAVGQIAEAKGARAVGIAGGPEKCRILVEEFGFDAAVDHRSPTLRADLAAATPDGIDVYFENVGGHVSAETVRRLNAFARIPVCGLIADYNGTGPTGERDRLQGFMARVLTKSLTVRGFIQDEFLSTHWSDFQRDMAGWVADGTVRYREDVVEGLENAVEAFRGLLSGRNVGKLLVKVADPAGARSGEPSP